jgi:ferredoxin
VYTLSVVELTCRFIFSLLLKHSIKSKSPDEGIKMTWTININRCVRCGGCVSVCPVAALELKDNIINDKILCTACGICAKACPVEAIKVTKQ